jgi:hypothetical protein
MAKISDVITKSVSFMLQSGTTLAPFWSGAYFSHSLAAAKDLLFFLTLVESTLCSETKKEKADSSSRNLP